MHASIQGVQSKSLSSVRTRRKCTTQVVRPPSAPASASDKDSNVALLQRTAPGSNGSKGNIQEPQTISSTPSTTGSQNSGLLSALPSQAVQQVSELASQLVASLPWPTLYPPGQGESSHAQQTTATQGEQVQIQNRPVPEQLAPFLTSVPVWELKQMRKLCHLTALTYKMYKVTPRGMRRRHGVELVTTSWACEIRQYEHTRSAAETMEEGDGMVVSVPQALSVYQSVSGRNNGQSRSQSATNSIPLPIPVPLPLPLDNNKDKDKEKEKDISATSQSSLGPTTSSGAADQQQQQQQSQQPQQPKRWTSPADMITSIVSDAAAAASAAAVSPLASAAGTLSSAAGTLYAGLASLPIASALGAGPRSSAPAAAAAIMSAAAAALNSKENGGGNQPINKLGAGLAAAAGPAAIAAAPGSSMRLAAPVQSTTGSPACPSEWFVCDEDATYTRYFVIQGSDTLDHWKLNLTFDPVPFEEPELGIKVHRGAYEAAQILYERFLPMVYEHIDSSPFAKICFTGHSIGGSLAILLAMMYYHRGVLPASSLSNVYTFGSPGIFCMDPPPETETEHHTHHTHNATSAGPEPTVPTSNPASNGHNSHENGNGAHSNGNGKHHAGATNNGVHVKKHAQKKHSHADGKTQSAQGAANGSAESQQSQQDGKGKQAAKASGNGTSNGNALLLPIPLPLSNGNAQAAMTAAAKEEAKPCQCGLVGAKTPLSAIGLPEHVVRNVIMARDIVPRAFACDYALVSEVLKTWGPTFKAHSGLSHIEHKHLYHFAGRMVVMQPDRFHWFMGPEPDHPLLPPGGDVYLMGHPSSSPAQQQLPNISMTDSTPQLTSPQSSASPELKGHHYSTESSIGDGSAGNHSRPSSDTATAHMTGNGNGQISPIEHSNSSNGNGYHSHIANGILHGDDYVNGTIAMTHGTHVSSGVVGQHKSDANGHVSTLAVTTSQTVRNQEPRKPEVDPVDEALWTLMDTPHPLDILTDAGAYLDKGSISRYHNPDNYAAALGRIIYLKRKAEGRFPRWVYHAYSKSLGMEARELHGPNVKGGYNDLKPWDSSDGDTTVMYPAMTLPGDNVVAAPDVEVHIPW